MQTIRMTAAGIEREALLHMDGWEGRTKTKVLVVGETPTRYRICAVTRTKLGGRNRWLAPGERALVPKRAITFAKKE